MYLLIVVVHVASYELLGDHVQRMIWIHQLLLNYDEKFLHVQAHSVDCLDVLDFFIDLLDLVLLMAD